jgi:hypothetical protein
MGSFALFRNQTDRGLTNFGAQDQRRWVGINGSEPPQSLDPVVCRPHHA